MAGGGLRLDSAGVGHDRARGGAEWVRGEVARLRVRGIEAGWRGVVGAELGGGSSSSLRDANARNGEGKDGLEASRPARGEERRRGAMADAWKLITGHSRRCGVGAARCRALEILCSLV